MTQPARSPLVGATPKHQQLRDLILGMARPGEPIPSERALAATYGISRATVREAIGGLVADGLLQRVQGLGLVRSSRHHGDVPAMIGQARSQVVDRADRGGKGTELRRGHGLILTKVS